MKERLKVLINSMDLPNRDTLMATVHFTLSISEHKETNKMNNHNMALMFAPNIFRPRRDVEEPASLATLG